MEKNKFFTFIFSCVPGAGYMYMNMMQVGTIAMLLFFGVFGIAFILRLEELLCILPVIWCYTFFDTFHVAKLDLETRETKQEKMMDCVKALLGGGFTEFISGKRKWIGIFAICLGIYIIFTGFAIPILGLVFGYYGSVFDRIIYHLPTVVIGLLLFYGGNKLLKQEKESKEQEEAPVEYEVTESSEE